MEAIDRIVNARPSRRMVFKTALATIGALFLEQPLLGDDAHAPMDTPGAKATDMVVTITPNDYIFEALGGRSIQDAVDACEKRRGSVKADYMGYYRTPLDEALGTNVSRSGKLGLVGGHLWDESENLDWRAPFAFAVDPNAKPVNGKALWFANLSSAADFRTGYIIGDPLEQMANRAIWAMQKGTRALAVIELEDEEGMAQLPQLTALLVTLGIQTIVLGNEPDSDEERMELRYRPDRIYQAGMMVRETLTQLGKDKVDVALPALDYGSEYGKRTLKLYEDVTKYGESPFTVVSYHYYGPPEDFPAWTRNEVARYTGSIPNASHIITEMGYPMGIIPNGEEARRVAIPGSAGRSLALAASSTFFSGTFYHALLDGANELHSLARVSGGRLFPNDTYLAFKSVAGLFTNPVDQSVQIEQNDRMGILGKRRGNDGTLQDFAVIWARGMENDGLKLSLDEILEDAQVFYINGQPTGERGKIILSAQTPKILLRPTAPETN